MHPYHHALSSRRSYGGDLADYWPLHNWFDASKSALAHFTHRALRHHKEGLEEARHLFGSVIVNSDGASIPTGKLGLQHLAEDMSIIPSAGDWLTHLDPQAPPLLTALDPLPPPMELATASARQFGVATETTLPVHTWFLETAAWFDDKRHLAMRCHAFGIFEAEARFGLVLGPASNPLPTRILAEWHVRTVIGGRIPAAADFLRRIKGQAWMAAAQNPRRLALV
jgi:hypothetical protein